MQKVWQKIVAVIMTVCCAFCLSGSAWAVCSESDLSSGCVNTNLFSSQGKDGCYCGDDKGSAIIDILILVLNILSGLVLVVAVVGIIIAGVQYLTARDNDSQVMKAKMRLFQIVIGLIVYALMWAFLNWIVPGGMLHTASTGGGAGGGDQLGENLPVDLDKLEKEEEESPPEVNPEPTKPEPAKPEQTKPEPTKPELTQPEPEETDTDEKEEESEPEEDSGKEETKPESPVSEKVRTAKSPKYPTILHTYNTGNASSVKTAEIRAMQGLAMVGGKYVVCQAAEKVTSPHFYVLNKNGSGSTAYTSKMGHCNGAAYNATNKMVYFTGAQGTSEVWYASKDNYNKLTKMQTDKSVNGVAYDTVTEKMIWKNGVKLYKSNNDVGKDATVKLKKITTRDERCTGQGIGAYDGVVYAILSFCNEKTQYNDPSQYSGDGKPFGDMANFIDLYRESDGAYLGTLAFKGTGKNCNSGGACSGFNKYEFEDINIGKDGVLYFGGIDRTRHGKSDEAHIFKLSNNGLQYLKH